MATNIGKPCAKCECWTCWLTNGVDPAACNVCTQDNCRSSADAARCTEDLVARLEDGTVRVKGAKA